MKFLTLLITAAFFSSIAISQSTTSTLTIFSEDGQKFFLHLNGEQQNNEAQTNIRVEDLSQPYYSCKIVFEDGTIAPLNKSNLVVKDMDDIHQDVVYRIKTDKNNGKRTLKFFSAEPAKPDYIPAQNVTVYRYGNPVPTRGGQTVVTTTTTTTPGASVNMNVGGIGVNVNVTDMGVTEQTTTTTTVSSHETHGGTTRTTPNRWGDCSYSGSMNQGDFSAALSTIKNSSFDETKLSTAKQILSSNCLKADQVVQICNLFGFDESKLEFAKFAYTHTIDRSNYFKVNNVFSFSSSKEELNDYIMSVK